MKLKARVPATSANLGPGFDCLALALDLYNEVTVDMDAKPVITWEGEGADELPTDGSDMVTRALASVARRTGMDLPSFALHGRNEIPLERGLGSSAAAAVAGIALATELLNGGEPNPDRLATFSLACEIERHPDNAAAAVYGGLTLAANGLEPVRLDPHPDLHPIALVPERLRLPTDRARWALPADVPRSDASFNVGRTALAVIALTQRPDLLAHALEDRLHQQARLSLVPEARDVFERIRSVGVPVCVSGSGPSLLAFGSGPRPVPDPGPGWRALPLSPSLRGASVEVS